VCYKEGEGVTQEEAVASCALRRTARDIEALEDVRAVFAMKAEDRRAFWATIVGEVEEAEAEEPSKIVLDILDRAMLHREVSVFGARIRAGEQLGLCSMQIMEGLSRRCWARVVCRVAYTRRRFLMTVFRPIMGLIGQKTKQVMKALEASTRLSEIAVGDEEVDGDQGDLRAECDRLTRLIRAGAGVSIAFAGVTDPDQPDNLIRAADYTDEWFTAGTGKEKVAFRYYYTCRANLPTQGGRCGAFLPGGLSPGVGAGPQVGRRRRRQPGRPQRRRPPRLPAVCDPGQVQFHLPGRPHKPRVGWRLRHEPRLCEFDADLGVEDASRVGLSL